MSGLQNLLCSTVNCSIEGVAVATSLFFFTLFFLGTKIKRACQTVRHVKEVADMFNLNKIDMKFIFITFLNLICLILVVGLSGFNGTMVCILGNIFLFFTNLFHEVEEDQMLSASIQCVFVIVELCFLIWG
jgi:hypothetical protein